MAGVPAFEHNVQQYEQWFMDHPLAYVSELHAIRELIPAKGKGMEIGIGTGRFAAPLGIKEGLEPSTAMAKLAEKKGIKVVRGVAEKMPFADGQFDFALMVTTVCFLDDMNLAFQEAARVLKPSGCLVIGFVDRESAIGREYAKDESAFYKDAVFYSVDQIVTRLKKAGFGDFDYRQTLFMPLDEMVQTDPVKPGHGQGSFVALRAMRT